VKVDAEGENSYSAALLESVVNLKTFAEGSILNPELSSGDAKTLPPELKSASFLVGFGGGPTIVTFCPPIEGNAVFVVLV